MNSNILFAQTAQCDSSYQDIANKVIDYAIDENCKLIAHAGFSFTYGKDETQNDVVNYIYNTIKNKKIKTYIAETTNMAKEYPQYFIITKIKQKVIKTPCYPQQFRDSGQKDLIEEFVDDMAKLPSMEFSDDNEFPGFLLICGENNVFNQANRGGSKIGIKPDSHSDRFLNALQNIQAKPWFIINPSHKPYTGKLMPQNIMRYHSSSSGDPRITAIITGNNRKSYKLKTLVNRPLLWKNGKSQELEDVLEDKIMHLFISMCHV